VRPLARAGGHLSRTAVAGSLLRSTREYRAGHPQALARAGVPTRPGQTLAQTFCGKLPQALPSSIPPLDPPFKMISDDQPDSLSNRDRTYIYIPLSSCPTSPDSPYDTGLSALTSARRCPNP